MIKCAESTILIVPKRNKSTMQCNYRAVEERVSNTSVEYIKKSIKSGIITNECDDALVSLCGKTLGVSSLISGYIRTMWTSFFISWQSSLCGQC